VNLYQFIDAHPVLSLILLVVVVAFLDNAICNACLALCEAFRAAFRNEPKA
jgi:hypothetical protein